MRAAALGVPVGVSPQQEAAYGSALLARQGARLASPSTSEVVM